MRARNIKPALFKNELLGSADPLVTLLFVGLWCSADREGRLEDRPLRLNAELFPYRRRLNAKKVEAMLDWLEQNKFIQRYVNGTARYILVLNFAKHQRPHRSEKPSAIPAPQINQGVTSNGGQPKTDDNALTPDPGYLTVESARRQARSRASDNRSSLGRKCPQDFSPDLHWATSLLPDIDAAAEAAQFKDHEYPRPRKDWSAAWRNWVRIAKKRGDYAKKDAIKWD